MTELHKVTILHFITRPGMYIQKTDDVNIISFITGYEIGSNRECDFTSILGKHLEQDLKITKLSTGWPGQVRQYAENKNLDWVLAFKQLAIEIL